MSRLRRRARERMLSGIVVLAPWLMSATLTALASTLRVRFVDRGGLVDRWARGEQSILAFWHNRVVLMPVQYGGRKVCIMNSQHRDGEIATRALERWGIRSVRGSATRGGIGGFRQLVGAYRDGFDLAVVPDGPRGPVYRAKPGVVHLARTTGAPIVPVTYAARWKARLRSWDGLIVPLPFSRVLFLYGEPLVVPREADDGRMEQLREHLENRLNDLTREAEEKVAAGA